MIASPSFEFSILSNVFPSKPLDFEKYLANKNVEHNITTFKSSNWEISAYLFAASDDDAISNTSRMYKTTLTTKNMIVSLFSSILNLF